MAKKITQDQVVQENLWQNTIDSTKLLIEVVDELDKSLKKVAKDSKTALAGNKKNDFDGLKGANEQVNKVNRAFEDKIKLDKQRIQLEDKIRQGRKVQAQQNEQLNQQLLAEKKARRELAKESLALTGAYAKESKKLNDLRNKYKNLAVAEKQNTKEGKALLSQITKLDSKLKRIDKTVGQSQRNVGNYTSAFKRLGGFLKNGLGFLGLTAGIAGLTRVLGGAIKIAKDFEQGNANLASVLGTTKDQITALTEDAKRLGAATSFSATEVSTLQTEFAKLGFNEKEILNATEATLNLAAATGSDLGEAAAIAGATLGGFGLDAKETQRVTDVMAKSFSTSALDLEKFKESMKGAAPAAKAVGINVETTTALLGTLANAGISGSKAGNNLKTSFINLNAAGLTLEQGLLKVAKSEDKLGTAAKLVGKNAAASFLVLAEGTEITKELEKGLNDAGGAAEKMAKEQLDTLEGKTKILNSAWEGFVLSLLSGDSAFSSISKSIVEAATSMLGFLTASEDVVEVSYENAIANKRLAESAEELLKKERLNEITLDLKDSLGDSVVAIDKETGAFTLNTEAVRTQIKLKRFASDQEAAALASRLKGVQEEIKRREFDKKTLEQELASRKRIASEAVKEFNETNKRTGRARLSALAQLDENKKLVKARRTLGDANSDLAKKRKQELDLIEKLKNLNFTAADVEALFTDEIKKNTAATNENGEATAKRSKIKVDKIKEEATLLETLKDKLEAVNKAREKIVFKEGSETAFNRLTEDAKQLEIQIKIIEDLLAGKEEPKKKLRTRDFEKPIEDERKRKKKEVEDAAKLEIEKRKKVLATLKALNDKFFEDKTRKADEEIDSTKKRESELRDLASQGNQDAQKSLGQNQKDQAEAVKKKEELLQREKQFELALAVISAFNSELDKGKDTGEALTSAITSTSVLTSFVAALPSFFDGTTDTGNSGTLDSNGGHLALLHDNERVVDKKNNMKMGGITNEDAANIVHDFNNDLLSYNTPQLVMKENRFDTNEQILSKFDTLEKSIVSAINNKEPYLGSDIDTIKKMIIQDYSKGGTRTKVKSKYPTRR
jgi:hypothetical protein